MAEKVLSEEDVKALRWSWRFQPSILVLFDSHEALRAESLEHKKMRDEWYDKYISSTIAIKDLGKELTSLRSRLAAVEAERDGLKRRVKELEQADYGFTPEQISAVERDMALTAWAEWLDTLPQDVECRSEQERDLYEKALRPKQEPTNGN